MAWGEADLANVSWEPTQSPNPANHRSDEADAELASGLGREPFVTECRGLPPIYLAFSPAKSSPDSPQRIEEEGGMSVRGGMGDEPGAAGDLGQTLVKIETPRLFWAVFDEMIYDAGTCMIVVVKGGYLRVYVRV
jgi:hypothetical protein